jgi:DNA-binding MarR family transcriptional regulator
LIWQAHLTFRIIRRLCTKRSEYGEGGVTARLDRSTGADNPVEALAAARLRHYVGDSEHFREVLRVEEGSLYPALHRMEEAGWIRAEWITKENGRRTRIYELTAAGRKQLGEEESRWQSVAAAINRVLREA